MKKSVLLRLSVKTLIAALPLILLVVFQTVIQAQASTSAHGPSKKVAVFWEEVFPFLETTPITRATLQRATGGDAAFLDASQLIAGLNAGQYDLLVLPYGSAFPVEAWGAIYSYLQSGGNLVNLGGRPFHIPVLRNGSKWEPGREQNAYHKELFIFQSETVDARPVVRHEINELYSFLDLPTELSYSTAYSLMIRMTDESHYKQFNNLDQADYGEFEIGWGSIDTKWDGVLRGATADGRLIAAPVQKVDHLQNNFAGSRWMFATFKPDPGFWETLAGTRLVSSLVAFARRGALDFTVRPGQCVISEGEQGNGTVFVKYFRGSGSDLALEVTLSKNERVLATERQKVRLSNIQTYLSYSFKIPVKPGFYKVDAVLKQGEAVVARYISGFWGRDPQLLRRGSPFTMGSHYFKRDGAAYPVIGMVYQSSENDRHFFLAPNPYVWMRDFERMKKDGINFLYTGFWGGNEQLMVETSYVREDVLRSIEAFILAASSNDLPVQLGFHQFMPTIVGGENSYLDPEAVRRNKDFMLAFVERFRDVPDITWDLVNEPSFSNPKAIFDRNTPNNDRYEAAAWNRFLASRYKTTEELAAAWNLTTRRVGNLGSVSLPSGDELVLKKWYRYGSPLRAYDYNLFAQEAFSGWIREMSNAIRATGDHRPITVGEDDGGITNRLLNQFIGSSLDFTSNHPWNVDEEMLWQSLAAKYPGKPNLMQETGIAYWQNLDQTRRRDDQLSLNMLERKYAFALAGESAGAIQWLWHHQAYKIAEEQTARGAIRPDGTERPEYEVSREMSRYVGAVKQYMGDAERPEVCIVLPQSLQLSYLNLLSVEAQQKSVRALHYYNRIPAYAVGEHQIELLGDPKLIIVPSPRGMLQKTWDALLEKASGGATVLVTGPVDFDEHFHPAGRFNKFGFDEKSSPLMSNEVGFAIGPHVVRLRYGVTKNRTVDAATYRDGRRTVEVKEGKGQIIFVGYPIELNENLSDIAKVYGYAIEKAGLVPPFTSAIDEPGVLIRPMFFERGVQYLVVSETDHPVAVSFQDLLTRAQVQLTLEPQRSALVMIDRKTGKQVAMYNAGAVQGSGAVSPESRSR